MVKYFFVKFCFREMNKMITLFEVIFKINDKIIIALFTFN